MDILPIIYNIMLMTRQGISVIITIITVVVKTGKRMILGWINNE